MKNRRDEAVARRGSRVDVVGEAVEEQQDENVANPLCLAEARTRDEEQEETAARL